MIIDSIKKAKIEAMKRHDEVLKGAYSILIARYQEALTSGSGKPVGDPEVIRIIQKFAKELEEEEKGYLTAGRETEAKEIALQKEAVSAFLPKMLSEEEIRAIVTTLPDTSLPAIMKHFKANYDGKVDMGLVNKVARSL
ncbi:MAG: GatB/YqeY domain-containing protein [Candidatus Enteromonas sp.]|nr:GatB/YqeY domain-containing protein [Candidatus Enteromonas sp.]